MVQISKGGIVNSVRVMRQWYLYLLEHVLQLDQELFGVFGFVGDAVQGLGKLALQRHTQTETGRFNSKQMLKNGTFSERRCYIKHAFDDWKNKRVMKSAPSRPDECPRFSSASSPRFSSSNTNGSNQRRLRGSS